MYTHTKQNAKDIYEIESKHTLGNIFILYIYNIQIGNRIRKTCVWKYTNIYDTDHDRNELSGYIFIHTNEVIQNQGLRQNLQ